MKLVELHRPHLTWQPSPLLEAARFHDEIERLFDLSADLFGTSLTKEWAPALDLHEDKESLVVTLEVPGMKKDAFEIALHDGILSISGERRFDESRTKASGYRRERFEGRFQRTLRLPKAVQADKVRATYKDGVLTVTLPIAEEAKPKQIVIGAE